MRISLSKFNCQIVLSSEDLAPFADFCSKNQGSYSSCALLADPVVYALYGESVTSILKQYNIPVHPLLLPKGEEAKSLATAENCWEEMAKAGLDRKSFVLSLGGGTVCDTAGFVSACYMRGIDVVHIPTTLLAMVDASIGGKTAINIEAGRSLVGAFHHPRLVLVAPHFLTHLPARELSSGLAEVIKASVISDPDLFDYLERYMGDLLAKNLEKLKAIIAKACKIKTEVIRADEKEKSVRAHLNYGHTFAHAIEKETAYKRYTHGEAVAIGMNYAARVSRLLGLLDDAWLARQEQLCQQAGLPTLLEKTISTENLLAWMSRDKKAVGGKIALVLPRAIGKVDLHSDVDPSLIRQVLNGRA
jgi:3-dehydroquinate synthase